MSLNINAAIKQGTTYLYPEEDPLPNTHLQSRRVAGQIDICRNQSDLSSLIDGAQKAEFLAMASTKREELYQEQGYLGRFSIFLGSAIRDSKTDAKALGDYFKTESETFALLPLNIAVKTSSTSQKVISNLENTLHVDIPLLNSEIMRLKISACRTQEEIDGIAKSSDFTDTKEALSSLNPDLIPSHIKGAYSTLKKAPRNALSSLETAKVEAITEGHSTLESVVRGANIQRAVILQASQAAESTLNQDKILGRRVLLLATGTISLVAVVATRYFQPKK